MRSSLFSRFLVALLLVLLAGSSARAWSFKEHIMFARIAAERIIEDPAAPSDLKEWLKGAIADLPPTMADEENYFLHMRVGQDPKGLQGISFWVIQPDIHAQQDKGSSVVEPFKVHERLLHFVDLELLTPPDEKKGYRHDLSGKPKLADIPRDMTDPRYLQAGMLPFRVADCYGQLVQSFRNGRMTAPTTQEQERKTAMYWAAYLAHYLADNTQPQHATLDYRSATYFADKRKAPNVHSEVEYRMCDDASEDFMDLRTEFWPLFVKQLESFQDPIETKDAWQSSIETSLASYDALPLIGVAAMAASKQAGTPEHPTGEVGQPFDTRTFFHFKGNYMGREMTVMEMKAIQNAWAVKRIERFWKQAWQEGKAQDSR